MSDAKARTTLYCSFCSKSQHEVRKLIAGPTVNICDECVVLCEEIIKEEIQATGTLDLNAKIPGYIWDKLAEEQGESVEAILTEGGYVTDGETVSVTALLRSILTNASDRINTAAPVRARIKELETLIEERRTAVQRAFDEDTQGLQSELQALRLGTTTKSGELAELPAPEPREDPGPELAVETQLRAKGDDAE